MRVALSSSTELRREGDESEDADDADGTDDDDDVDNYNVLYYAILYYL